MKRKQQKFLKAQFRASGRKYSPTSLEEWKMSRVRLTRIVILTNFGSICRNLGNIFQFCGLYTNSWWPWFAMKWTQQNFLNAHLRASGPKYSPLHFLKDWKNSRDRLARIVIFTNSCSISRNLGDIFQSRRLWTNSWSSWFAVKWARQKFLNAHFRASWPKYSPTSL